MKGIYVGSNRVIHFTSLNALTSLSTPSTSYASVPDGGLGQPNSQVIVTSVAKFLLDGSLYRYQYGVTKAIFSVKVRGGCCTTAISDKVDTVIHRAEYLLKNNGFGKYSLTKNNCEDFSLYCKTGLRIVGTSQMRSSGQISSVVAAPETLFGAATIVATATLVVASISVGAVLSAPIIPITALPILASTTVVGGASNRFRLLVFFIGGKEFLLMGWLSASLIPNKKTKFYQGVLWNFPGELESEDNCAKSRNVKDVKASQLLFSPRSTMFLRFAKYNVQQME
ncbi:hypothetical protein L1887_41853 [Cichorium endivia]|nr:hypothetical protein L1887_41853 [Cichorium endivia]